MVNIRFKDDLMRFYADGDLISIKIIDCINKVSDSLIYLLDDFNLLCVYNYMDNGKIYISFNLTHNKSKFFKWCDIKYDIMPSLSVLDLNIHHSFENGFYNIEYEGSVPYYALYNEDLYNSIKCEYLIRFEFYVNI